jgi:hypothetical protein
MTYGQAALAKQDPFRAYYQVVKVIETRNSEALSTGERIFALCSRLIGQVFNGGFDQYFSTAALNMFVINGRDETLRIKKIWH